MSAGTCTCENLYQKDGFRCIVACEVGYVDNGNTCTQRTEPAVSFVFDDTVMFNGGWYTDSITISSICNAYDLSGRGLWFDEYNRYVSLTGIQIVYDFTVELWINPTASGTIFSFMVNRGIENGNLWVSECYGLVLDFGY